jgi:hypothetical protein
MLNQSPNNRSITAGPIATRIAARRLRTMKGIVAISSSHDPDWLPSLALARKWRARSVGCFGVGCLLGRTVDEAG